MKKIILFELNEVPMKIVRYFVRARPESTLAKILPTARKFETFAEDAGELSPWITWPTFHRGVSNRKHYINAFGQPLDEIDKEFPPVWKILTDYGRQVGMFGSLHSYPPPQSYENYSFYVPDVFASGKECFPKSIEAFQAFNLRMSRESARNVSNRVPVGEAVSLLLHFSELGFKPRTMADVARQLVEERLDRWKVIRRRTYQTVLAFDVFLQQLTKKLPDFTTFFTNHVASSLHRYWAAAFPEEYDELGYDSEWLNTFNKEILFTMDKADEMIGRLTKFVDLHPEFQLIIATSMGQKATLAMPVETQVYAVNPEAFMSRLGVPVAHWQRRPAMVPQLNVQVDTMVAPAFEAHLRALAVDGIPVPFERKAEGFYTISFGQLNLTDPTVTLAGARISLGELGLANVEITDKSGTTAYHIPEGTLLIYEASAAPSEAITQISTVDVAPYILSNYGVKVPDYMGGRAYSLR